MLTATNDFRQTASISRTVTVTSSLPAGTVDFKVSPTAPGVNDTVNFNAAASTVANATYKWDFGDGTERLRRDRQPSVHVPGDLHRRADGHQGCRAVGVCRVGGILR